MFIRRLLSLGVPTLVKFRCRQGRLYDEFDEIIQSYLHPDSVVLDAGCGEITRAAIGGRCQMAIGADESRKIIGNKGVDERVLADLVKLPFKDKTFDLIISYSVVEHLLDPEACFREFYRVCKDEGIVVIATPNSFHYGTLVVKLTPYPWHNWFLKNLLGAPYKTFPTVYGANTPGKLMKIMRKHGFTKVEMRCIDVGPKYMDWLTPLYAIGLIYHRIVNRFEKLSFLRADLIGIFRREEIRT